MSAPIHIGVFIPNEAQFLDTATVDVLGSMSREYLELVPIPQQIIDMAPKTTISYITSPRNGKDIPMTSGGRLKATHHYGDADVAPGKLSVIVVPGPYPDAKFDKEGLQWLHDHSQIEGVDILSVCTGVLVCGEAGILEGKTVSGPKMMQDELQKKYPTATFTGANQRWVRDGNLWSSGGVTNGNDLMAAFARESGRWPQPVVDLGLEITDVGDRKQFYNES
ncbi:ThiJ/PfpI family protein [Emericellopsis atlantica]|uniref:ThiJ/PfpI family protein n=1 Tax=Emericellopsis atlantica TaxID=2614577 RepID=A0A9P7ZDE7_9HYPO|nr:ThiJ/PfpI family protein [Emericellopsis atlantica]KAG9250014.1 ThiJ/PfpI family protein [Emericellopsis atlantica]